MTCGGSGGMNFCGLFENVRECLKMCSQKSHLRTYLFPRYHPDTTPKGYRKDTEGISKGYESHSYRIVIV